MVLAGHHEWASHMAKARETETKQAQSGHCGPLGQWLLTTFIPMNGHPSGFCDRHFVLQQDGNATLRVSIWLWSLCMWSSRMLTRTRLTTRSSQKKACYGADHFSKWTLLVSLFVFQDRVSLCIAPGTPSVHQTNLILTHLPLPPCAGMKGIWSPSPRG